MQKTNLGTSPGIVGLIMALFVGLSPLGAFNMPKVVEVLPKPTAELTRFEIKTISLRDITFLCELSVKNPYPVGLSFSGMTMDFSVEGQKIVSLKSQGGFDVPANKSKTNQFDVKLTYEGIIALVKNYIDKEWLSTSMDGTLTIPLPAIKGLPKDITFSYRVDQKIPAIKPQVSILEFKVNPPSAKQLEQALIKAASKVKPDDALGYFGDLVSGKKPKKQVIDPKDLDVPFTVSYTLAIKNEAKAALGFDKLGFSLDINNQRLVDGESSEVKREGNTTLVTIDNTFSSKQLVAGVLDAFNARLGNFRIRGTASLRLPESISKKPLPLDFDETGSFKL